MKIDTIQLSKDIQEIKAQLQELIEYKNEREEQEIHDREVERLTREYGGVM